MPRGRLLGSATHGSPAHSDRRARATRSLWDPPTVWPKRPRLSVHAVHQFGVGVVGLRPALVSIVTSRKRERRKLEPIERAERQRAVPGFASDRWSVGHLCVIHQTTRETASQSNGPPRNASTKPRCVIPAPTLPASAAARAPQPRTWPRQTPTAWKPWRAAERRTP